MKLMPIYKSILLTELAVPRKVIVNMIFNRAETIIYHILYIILFSHEKENVKHWKKEILDRFIEINNFVTKPKNRKLKKEQYFEILHDYLLETKDELNNVINAAKFKKNNLKPKEDINIKELHILLKEIYNNISEKISDKTLTIDFLNKDLDEVINFSLK